MLIASNTLVQLLNPRIGTPLSLNALIEDLGVAFETVRKWIITLERLYYVCRIQPYSQRFQRTNKREKKYYFWDWSEVQHDVAQ